MGNTTCKTQSRRPILDNPPPKRPKIDNDNILVKILHLEEPFELTPENAGKSAKFTTMMAKILADVSPKLLKFNVDQESVNDADIRNVYCWLNGQTDGWSLTSANVLPTLVIASYLRVAELIETCMEMIRNIANHINVCEMYTTAKNERINPLKDFLIKHLRTKFGRYIEDDEFLRVVPRELLVNMMDCGVVFAYRNEDRLYDAAKRYIMIDQLKKLGIHYWIPIDFKAKNFRLHFNKHFNPLEYKDVLSTIRLGHILCDTHAWDDLKSDGLFPREIIDRCAADVLYSICMYPPLYVPREVSNKEFHDNCVRTGHFFRGEAIESWSWTKLIPGIYLEFFCNGESVTVTRELSERPLDLTNDAVIRYSVALVTTDGKIIKEPVPTTIHIDPTHELTLVRIPQDYRRTPLYIFTNMYLLSRRYTHQHNYWAPYFFENDANLANPLDAHSEEAKQQRARVFASWGRNLDGDDPYSGTSSSTLDVVRQMQASTAKTLRENPKPQNTQDVEPNPLETQPNPPSMNDRNIATRGTSDPDHAVTNEPQEDRPLFSFSESVSSATPEAP
uniref:BACK domain-containing protein n=1 Tax=Panagrellus redivivus TaxID=6233 RepID=A0A7E4V8P4_PANRE